jgi:group I intron endonuclease
MSKEIISGIYCFENMINGKKYIGQAQDIQERIRVHRRDLENNKENSIILQYAWNKYGEENFNIYIIEICDIDQLDDKEIFWIKELQSHISENGYNVSFGGNSVMRGRHHSEESKNKISINSKVPSGENSPRFGIPLSDETKNNISKTLLKYYETHTNPGKGIPLPEKTRKKMSERKKGQKVSEKTKKKMSDSRKGRKFSSETRQKISVSKKGKKMKEETKQKISKSKKGKKYNLSDETKKKVSEYRRSLKRKNSSSKYIGVCYDKSQDNWIAYITFNGKRINLPRFKTEKEAAQAYNKKSIELYGENAILNKIDE